MRRRLRVQARARTALGPRDRARRPTGRWSRPSCSPRGVRDGWRIAEVGVHHRPRIAGEPTGGDPRVVARAFRERRALPAGRCGGAHGSGHAPRREGRPPGIDSTLALSCVRAWRGPCCGSPRRCGERRPSRSRSTTGRSAAWAARGTPSSSARSTPRRRVAIDKPPGRPVAAGRGDEGRRLRPDRRCCCRPRSPARRRRRAVRPAAHALRTRAPRWPGRSRWRCCRSRCITARSDTMDSRRGRARRRRRSPPSRGRVRARQPWLLLVAGLALGLDVRGQARSRGSSPRRASRSWRGSGCARAPAGRSRAQARSCVAVGARVAGRAAAARRRAPAVGLRLDGRVGVERGVRLRRRRAAEPAARARGERGLGRARPGRGAGRCGCSSRARGLGLRVGLELAAALLVAGLVLVRRPRPRERAARAGGGGCSRGWRTASCWSPRRAGCARATWRRVDPAIAAVLGAGAVLAARRWVLAAAARGAPRRARRLRGGGRPRVSRTPGRRARCRPRAWRR